MRFICFAVLVALSPVGLCQSGLTANDSLPLRILEAVTIQSFAIEGDRWQNFYRTNPSSTTENILCHLPGMYLIRRGSYGQEPMVRGMASGQLSVTIDGMKMFGACTDKMDPVTIYVEPQNLKQIEVVPGVSGSFYGTTVGGAVNLLLAQPDFAVPLGIQLGSSFFSASQGLASYAVVNKSYRNSAYRFSSVYRKHQNYRAGNGEIIPYTQYEKVNLMLAGAYAVNATDTLRAEVLTDFGWNIGFPALPMDVGYANTTMAGITISRVRLDSWLTRFRVKGYANLVYHEMDDTQRPDVVMHMDMPGQSETIGFFAEGEAKKIKDHALSFRLDGYANHVLAEMTMYPENESPMYMQTWPEMTRMVWGFYGRDTYALAPRTALTADVRADWAGTYIKEGFGMDQLRVFYPDLKKVEYRLPFNINTGISHYVGREVQLTVQVGYGQRIPSLSEHAGFYLFNRMDGYDYVGNPYLKNEKSWSLNASANYWQKAWELQATVFVQQFQNYIFSATDATLSPMTPGSNGVRVYENISGAHFAGAEGRVSWTISPAFQVMDQVKFVSAQMVSGQPLPLIPPLVHQLSLRFNRKVFSLQADLEQNAAQHRIHAGFGEDKTPGYSILNFRGEYRQEIQNLKISLQAGVENLSDAHYHAHLDWGNISRPGRNVYVTVEVRF
ncbi:MAG: TonB-dependent receptor plug domain-containing protein [Cyclobacteriaceae bacterium]